jgi:hypothetical protein
VDIGIPLAAQWGSIAIAGCVLWRYLRDGKDVGVDGRLWKGLRVLWWEVGGWEGLDEVSGKTRRVVGVDER